MLAQESAIQELMRRITDTGKALHRAWVEEVFAPFLAEAGDARGAGTDLLVVATDVYTWKLLRRDRRLGRERTERRMRHLVDALLAAAAPPPTTEISTKENSHGRDPLRHLGRRRQRPPGPRHRHGADVARARRTRARPPEPAGVARPRPGSRSRRRRRRGSSRPSTNNSPLALVAMFGDRGLGRDVLAALAERPADMVVVDCLLFGVMAELREAGRPYAVARAPVRRLPARRLDAGADGSRHAGQAAAADPALAGARLRLVASLPSARPGRREPAPGADLRRARRPVLARAWPARPMVLVSLSTFRFPRMSQCLQTIMDACAGLDARVVVTTGPVVDPAELRAPANAEVHRFVPHAELMPQGVAGRRSRRPWHHHAGPGP